jgi:hypothetical protein
VILNERGYSGPDFACVAFLSPVTREENFTKTAILSFLEAPNFASQEYCWQGLAQWQENFNFQMKAVFPKDAPELSITLKTPS